MENGKDYEILDTNLQPFFWRKIKNIIRQNKKAGLHKFLFGSQDSIPTTETQNDLNEKIETLQIQVNSLQDRIRDLETTLENSKYSLSGTLKASEATKIIQQDEYTLKSEQSPNLLGNDNKINPNIQQVEEFRNEISESVSEASKRPLKQSLKTEQYNLSSNQDKGLNGANFITLGNLSEQEKIEIIQTGFRLNQERKISLKNYSEGTEEYSLFQHKGYNIKYESIRRTKLYQSLKR